MELKLNPVLVATSAGQARGWMAFADGVLVAIVVRLDPEAAVQAGGEWFLEAGFGDAAPQTHPVFQTEDEAVTWIRRRLESVAGPAL